MTTPSKPGKPGRGNVWVDGNAEVFQDHTDEVRLLGCLPSNRVLLSAVPTWVQAGNALVPEKDWAPFDNCPDDSVIPIKDQNGWNGCTHWALNRSGECARHASGQDYVELAPEYSYFLTTRGMNVGTNIMDGLEFAETHGLAPRSDVPPNTRSPARLSELGKADAPRFKFLRGAALTSPAEMISALLQQEPVEYSVRVGNGFDSLDPEGCVTLGWGPTNHAVMGYARLDRSKKGRWKGPLDNSWSTRWGNKGTAWVYVDDLFKQSSFEAFHLIAVADDPLGPKVLPPA